MLSDLVHRPAPTTAPVLAGVAAEDLDLDEEEQRQLRNGVVRLRVPHRYGAGIGALAEAVRTGDADRVLGLLASEAALSLVADEERPAEPGRRRRRAARRRGARAGTPRPRWACSAATGCCARTGTARTASRPGTTASRAGSAPPPGQRHPGQPLLVTANDYENRLYNGDAGVVVQTGDGLRAAFAAVVRSGAAAAVAAVLGQTAHAMTVHRSQGSQYDDVTVLLPTPASAILTRELLYTAVTRARARVRLVGTRGLCPCCRGPHRGPGQRAAAGRRGVSYA